ncbi:hypothetical protein ACFE04_026469 [Oxalis oulophora]
MAIISCSKRKTLYNVRSISFPARLHPTTRRVHEELNKLKSLESSSSSSSLSLGESICLRLSGLAELYRCIQDLLNLPSTLQALAQTQLYEKWINDLLETSLNYLDVCSKTRETVLSLKQSLTEVQSALRRSNYKVADSSFKGYINGNRKMVKKETGSKCLASLKQVSTINGGEHEQEVDEHVSSIVRVIEETSLMTNSILSSLLLFLMKKKVKPTSSKWSLVSKLVQKKKPVCVDDHQYHDHETRVNELEVVDVALLVCKNYCVEDEIEKLEGIIEGFENGLDCLFRRLISTRVSLLNILSQ